MDSQGKRLLQISAMKCGASCCVENTQNLGESVFNRNNCSFILESMRHAKIKKGTGASKEDFKKDKDDERNIELDQRTTTHYSDAIDTLLYGISEKKRVPISAGGVITT